MLRSLAVAAVLTAVAAPAIATPLPPQPAAVTQQQPKQPLRYRTLDKMLRKFSREAGEPRARG